MTKSRNKKLSPRKNKSRRRTSNERGRPIDAPPPASRIPEGRGESRVNSAGAAVQLATSLDATSPLVLIRWRPAWHGLDQSLRVGVLGEYGWGPIESVDRLPRDAASFEFSRGLTNEESAACRPGMIVSIEHPTLGSLQAVDTQGLDYSFVLADGRELLVNAEETPGQCDLPEIDVDDWSLLVRMRDRAPTVS